MKKDEIAHLRFRRQYILAPKSIDCPFLYNSLKITEDYTLYAHIDLLVTVHKKEKLHLILLGDIFDYIPEKSNKDILADLADDNLEIFLHKLSRYSGCFVLIYVKSNKLVIVTDATSTKKVYHCRFQSNVWCASQPHLLAKITGIKRTGNISKLEYYSSEEFSKLNNSNVGDTTIYDEISQLTRNSYLEIINYEIIRFYPSKKLGELSLRECADKCSKLIQGYIESIAQRYDLMLPVTAGKDSRGLLSGTYNIRGKVYYYINKEDSITEKSNDLKIPKALFKKLNLDFHVLNLNAPIDEDFRKVYYENNPLASDSFLPHIYNYYKNFSDKVNLPGNIVTTSIWHYPSFKKNVTWNYLTNLNGISRFPHAREAYSNWIKSTSDLCLENNFYIMNLFYWEERLGNWGTQTGIDKEIAQLEFNPYNSRELVDTIYSLKQPYRTDFGRYSFHSAIYRKLWPDLLQVPINPCKKNNILILAECFGLLGLFHRIKSTLTN